MTYINQSALAALARMSLVLAALSAASCAPQQSSLQQMQASNPSVTYKYRTDDELVQANQNAAAFCSRYQSAARTASFANDPDGSKVVVFECVQQAQAVTQPSFNPNLTYTYTTDQQLLDASRNARAYCMNNGSQQVFSTIVNNTNGTKTVTFRCSA